MRKNIEQNNRTPRSAETRAKDTARKPLASPHLCWIRLQHLKEYTYRWIRAELVGEEDRKNVMSRMREGFELVRS